MNLRIPLENSNVIEYDCPTCGGRDLVGYKQDNKHGLSLDICKACGFIFRSQFLDERSSLDHLRSYHKSLPGIAYYQKQKQKEYIIEKNFIPYSEMKDKRVLEVGSGVGTYLGGLNSNCVGLEPAVSHSMFAIEEENIDSRPTLYVKDSNFDVIIIHDYLHYIPNVGEYLDDLRSKLTDDGLIYIYNPIIDLPSMGFLRSSMGGIPLQYVSLFTRRTLKGLVEAHGFNIVKTDSNISDFLMVLSKGVLGTSKVDDNFKSSKKYLDDFINILRLSKEGKHEEVLKVNKNILTSYLHLVKKEGDIVVSVDEAFDEISKNMPDYAPAIGTVASALGQKGELDRALELFSRFEQKIMDPPTARAIAMCHHDKGDFARSVQYLKLEEGMTGPNAELYGLKASLYWQKRSIKEFF